MSEIAMLRPPLAAQPQVGSADSNQHNILVVRQFENMRGRVLVNFSLDT